MILVHKTIQVSSVPLQRNSHLGSPTFTLFLCMILFPPQPLQIKLILFILMPLKILGPDKVQVMDLTEKNWISKMPQAQIPWNYNSNKQTKNRTRNQEAAKKAYLWPKLLSTWASAAAQNNINNKQETGSRLILQCQGFVWDRDRVFWKWSLSNKRICCWEKLEIYLSKYLWI